MNPYSGYGEGFLAYDDEEYLEQLSQAMLEETTHKDDKMSKEDYDRMLLGLNFKKRSSALNLSEYDAMLIGMLRISR